MPRLKAPLPDEKARQMATGASGTDVLLPADRTILAIAVVGSHLRVGCGNCTNFHIFEPRSLWWAFAQRGWSDGLADATARMRCTSCGKKAAKICAVDIGEPVRSHLPSPPQWAWERAERDSWAKSVRSLNGESTSSASTRRAQQASWRQPQQTVRPNGAD